jgi:hypothetical protein
MECNLTYVSHVCAGMVLRNGWCSCNAPQRRLQPSCRGGQGCVPTGFRHPCFDRTRIWVPSFLLQWAQLCACQHATVWSLLRWRMVRNLHPAVTNSCVCTLLWLQNQTSKVCCCHTCVRQRSLLSAVGWLWGKELVCVECVRMCMYVC